MVMTSNKKVHLQSLYRQKPFVLCLLCSADLLLLRPKYLHLAAGIKKGGDYILLKSAGLPNIIGIISNNNGYAVNAAGSNFAKFANNGCYTFNSTSGTCISTGTISSAPIIESINFNASAYNKIYGNSEIVQPPALEMICQYKF